MNDSNTAAYNYLVNHASIVFLKVEKTNQISFANKYAQKIWNDRLIGKKLEDVFLDFNHNIDWKNLAESNQEVMLNINMTDGEPDTFYFRFYKKDNQIDVLGEPDREEVENLRTELLDMNNELSNTTRELHKKNAELRKLDDLKSHFLNAAAHDLRNPMGNIIRLSEFLLDELNNKLNKQQLQFLSLIKSLSSFGLDLLNDLLNLARIESGRLLLNKQPVNLIEVFKEVIKLNQFSSHKKNIRIKMDVFEKMESVMADESSIKQVMDNLLNNAIKFSPPDTTISVGVFSGNDSITVFVKDQGPGISDDQLDKLFIPFSKVNAENNRNAQGTGLGLSIVKKIITGHNGKIWVKSEEDKGTTFYFSLPLDNSLQVNLKNNG